jgi:gas vesicle protein GvpN
MLIYGDEEFGSSDLLGGDKGVVSKRVIDNFIRTVLKTEETVRSQWVDHRLTIACKNGYTLLYDEFSRSHAEANNALLSILEERILALPEERGKASYLRVHPEFRAIFTSNPDEYAGVYTPQSALLDRMVTLRLEKYDRDTEIEITRVKSGLPLQDARRIVDLVTAVRNERDGGIKPSIRACIMMGQILRHRQGRIKPDDPVFLETCADLLGSALTGNGRLQHIIEDVLAASTSPMKGEEDANPDQGQGAAGHQE